MRNLLRYALLKLLASASFVGESHPFLCFSSMGSAYSNMIELVDAEFLRVQKVSSIHEARRNITLPELIDLRLPDGYELDLHHLGVLYMLDANRDGAFSYDDIISFIQWVHGVTSYGGREAIGATFGDFIQARALLQLWGACHPVAAEAADNLEVVSWVLLLLERACPSSTLRETVNGTATQSPSLVAEFDVTPASLEGYDGQDDEDEDEDRCPIRSVQQRRKFGLDALALLRKLLGVEQHYNMDVQSFLAVLTQMQRLENRKQTQGETCDPQHVSELHLTAFVDTFFTALWRLLSEMNLRCLVSS